MRLVLEVGGELNRVQMPPTAFSRLVVKFTGFAAFGTQAAPRFVIHVDVYLKNLNIEINTRDFPWRLKPEQITSYPARFEMMLTQLRKDLGAESVPLLMGEVIPGHGNHDAINIALGETAKKTPNCVLVSFADLGKTTPRRFR